MTISSINKFLEQSNIETPCLVMDLAIVKNSYIELQKNFPSSLIYYAVKANPAIEIINCLKNIDSNFDVSSKKEIELCLSQSINPSKLSYGSTIKKEKDISWAYSKGLRLFAFDSLEELNKIQKQAKNAKVFCRLQVPNEGANWPLSKKFGCSINMTKGLMLEARKKGLIPTGISFHVGSQQTNIKRWFSALKMCHEVYAFLKENNIVLDFINIGGGIPVNYQDFNFNLEKFSKELNHNIKNIFNHDIPKIMIEPGRFLVAESGVIESEVILVSKKDYEDNKRWVYLDMGRFSGLAETEGEAIKYKILPLNKKNLKTGPVIIAGPSCDGADILFEKYNYELPLSIKSGDKLRIYSTGAYTSVYGSDFNGLQRLKEYFINIT